MKNFILNQVNRRTYHNAIISLLLVILWIIISTALNAKEKVYSTFEFQTMLQAKTLLIAITFTGRYLLFPQYRFGRWRKWFYGASILLGLGMNLYRVLGNFKWFYFIWVCGDTFLWAIFCAAIIEVICGLFIYWGRLYSITVDFFGDIWKRAWKDILYLGLWLTLIAGTVYFYLVNFFIIDTVAYIYLLAILLGTTGISLFATIQSQIVAWVNRENQLIDHQMTQYLDWQEKTQDDIEQNISLVQYLLMLRDYFTSFKKPILSLKTFIIFLVFEGLILILPYIIGVVVEV